MKDKPFSQQKMSFEAEELDRLGQAVEELDEAVGNALIDLNRRDKSESGQWNLVMALYILIKSNQQKVKPTITAKGLYKQVKELERLDLDLQSSDDI